eukprot:7193425-Alexandrium_andersonii.AAC.1
MRLCGRTTSESDARLRPSRHRRSRGTLAACASAHPSAGGRSRPCAEALRPLRGSSLEARPS